MEKYRIFANYKVIEMGVFKMGIQRKRSNSITNINTMINNMIFDAICNIVNGSVTIIKQDKTVIQINVSEKISLDDEALSEDFVKEAVL
jgi:hypothetical protein